MKPRKKGRPRIEDRARTIEARKPWLKLEMSRRTWHRRQAEKRQGKRTDLLPTSSKLEQVTPVPMIALSAIAHKKIARSPYMVSELSTSDRRE
jgi:hypothetical protein